MVMWSNFHHFASKKPDGQRAHLSDAALDLTGGDYPCVTHLVLHNLGQPKWTIPWGAVESIEWRDRTVVVRSLDGDGEPDERAILLDRDVMDALILDVPRRQSMRANDLWLAADEKGLCLRAADIGPWAVLRRLGRGILGREANRSLVDWRDVEFLRGDPEDAREGRDYHRRVAALQPAEIATLLASLPYMHAAELLTILPDDLAADTLEVMEPDRQVAVWDELDRERQVRLLQLMAPDNATDLLARLGPDGAEALLEAIPDARRHALIELLRYPEDTAGGIMTNEVVVVPSELTVAQARRALRDELARPDFVYYVYAVDDVDSRKLQGVITLRDLLVADDTHRVSEVMRSEVEMLFRHAALPVVATDGRLVGAITVDAALRVIAPEQMISDLPRVFS